MSKLFYKIDHPSYSGFFVPEETIGRGVRLVTAREGAREEGRVFCLYFLVDESDGIIVDVRYQVFGPPHLIGALEAACSLLMGKNYNQARRITADLIDREVRGQKESEAFPKSAWPLLNQVISAIETFAEQCSDIPFVETYVASPLHPDTEAASLYPGWENLPKHGRLAVIEEVIQKEIRPYIELDAGGIQIIDLSDKHELTIAYEGSCTTCYSATGSTLSAIQQILQTTVHPNILVIPKMS
jgi:NifU-like protein